MSATSHTEREERLKRPPRPRPYHSSLLLRLAEGETVAEAANGLGLSVRTAHRWLARHRDQVEAATAELTSDFLFRRRLELALSTATTPLQSPPPEGEPDAQ